MKTVTLKTAGFALIALGLTISALTYFWTRAMNAVPLSVPITLSPGHFQSPVFKTHVSTQHVIDIAFNRSLPPDQMDCFIGMNLSSNACSDEPTILNVTWHLLANHETVASGSSNGRGAAAYSYNLIERHIDSFGAKRGTEYTLDLDVLQDGSRLGSAHPILRVGPSLNRYEGRLLLAGFLFYAGLACAAIGAVMVYRKRNQQPVFV